MTSIIMLLLICDRMAMGTYVLRTLMTAKILYVKFGVLE